MTEQAYALATDVLKSAWLWRWAFIVGVGAVPAVARLLLPGTVKAGAYATLRRYSALTGFALCLVTLPLAIDTFGVESQHPEALNVVACTVASVPQNRWSWLTCEEGDLFFVEQGLESLPGDFVDVHYLPWSRVAVRVAPPGQ